MYSPNIQIFTDHVSKHSAQINNCDRDGLTPLYHHAQKGHVSHIQVLLTQKNLDINHADDEGRTAIYIASVNVEDTRMTTKCLEHDKYQQHKIDMKSSRHFKIVNLLLDAGALDTIYSAAARGDVVALKNIVDICRVDINRPKQNGATALFSAAQSCRVEVIKYLCSLPDIDVNLCNIKGTSPLCRASEQNLIGRKECVSILINSGAIDSPHSSAARGDVAALSQFLTNQAADINDINATTKIDGTTILYTACQAGRLPIVDLLLSHPTIDVNKEADDGWTPLIHASQEGHTHIIKRLLQVRSLNINKSTKKQTTAISVASQRGHLDIVALFVNRYDCDINICDWNGFSPLYIASQRGHHAVVRCLLTHSQINKSSRTENNWTPLLTASNNGHYQVVQELLDAGVDVNESLDHLRGGSTSLYVASKLGHVQIVQLLLTKQEINIYGNTRFRASRAPGRSNDRSALKVVVQSNTANKLKILNILLKDDRMTSNVNHLNQVMNQAADLNDIETLTCFINHGIGDTHAKLDNWTPTGNSNVINWYNRCNSNTKSQLYLKANNCYTDFIGMCTFFKCAYAARRLENQKSSLKIFKLRWPLQVQHIICSYLETKKPIQIIMERISTIYSVTCNLECNDGRETPLTMACLNDDALSVQMLLKQPNIDINKTNIHSCTPLICAAKMANLRCVHFLLKHSKQHQIHACYDDSFSYVDLCEKRVMLEDTFLQWKTSLTSFQPSEKSIKCFKDGKFGFCTVEELKKCRRQQCLNKLRKWQMKEKEYHFSLFEKQQKEAEEEQRIRALLCPSVIGTRN